jgi:hypothetical protein
MVIRWCGHCENEIEVPDERRVACPVCGLDPNVPPRALEDALAGFLADPARTDADRIAPNA